MTAGTTAAPKQAASTTTPSPKKLKAWLSIDETGFYAIPLNCVVIAEDETQARALVAEECKSRMLDPSYFVLKPLEFTKPGLHLLGGDAV